MYFPDLTSYSYHGHPEPESRNVGWLDSEHDFPCGPVPVGFVERLLAFSKKPAKQHRGFHICQFCGIDPHLVIYDQAAMQRLNEAGALGSAEIRVVGRSRVVYASPTMICHYVAAHRYQPPQEFIDAVMEMEI